MKSINDAQDLLRSSVNLKNNFFSDKVKGIESILEENMRNLDNNVGLGKDLEQSVNDLCKILANDENLHKWQQVVPPQSYGTVLQQKKNSEDKNQVEENK